MQGIDIFFSIAILIISIIVHEVSHGYTANLLGDPTAKLEGRLTLNPIKHLDFMGSIVIPLITYSLGGFIFGWAKPVPYNPYNLRNQKWGTALVAGAGPLSNLLLATIFGLLVRFSDLLNLSPSFIAIAITITFINVLLMTFNLIPIPPLDGSKILFSILPYRYRHIQEFLERNSIFLVLILIFFLWRFLLPVVELVFRLITGMELFL